MFGSAFRDNPAEASSNSSAPEKGHKRGGAGKLNASHSPPRLFNQALRLLACLLGASGTCCDGGSNKPHLDDGLGMLCDEFVSGGSTNESDAASESEQTHQENREEFRERTRGQLRAVFKAFR